MKRLHVHVTVSDLKDSVRFYSQLFASEPTVLKPDYAKWMLEDPRVNFAISDNDDRRVGINHLGVQAESSEELEEINVRLKEARQARGHLRRLIVWLRSGTYPVPRLRQHK